MTLSEVFLSLPAMAVWGLCVGSFLNVVIHRLPRMMERDWKLEASAFLQLPAPEVAPISLLAPGSACPSCGHSIRWYENIPVASWIWLRGRCSACRARISVRYPIVELVTAILFVLIGWRIGARPEALLWCGFAAALLALALVDADTQLLPDDIVQPLLWSGLIAASLGWIAIPLKDSVLGAVAGYLLLWFVAKVYGLVRRIDEPMGQGDFKLLAVFGAWFGWQLLPSIILLSSAVGAIVGLVGIALNGREWQAKIPFGPYLAGGGMAAFFFGAELTRLYFPAGAP